jgi:hypothetical protein
MSDNKFNIPRVTIQQTSRPGAVKKERYTRLSEFYPSEWTPGIPVVLQRGAVLQDNVSGGAALQLKFSNCGEETVSAVYVSVECFDVAGDPWPSESGPLRAEYLDIGCEPGAFFGNKQLIPLPSRSLRSFTFTFEKIVLENGVVLRHGDEESIALEAPVPLDTVISEDVLSLLPQNNRSRFVPQKLPDGRWRCVCGSLAWKETCPDCGTEKEYARLFLSPDALERHLLREKADKGFMGISDECKRVKTGLPDFLPALMKVISCLTAIAVVCAFITYITKTHSFSVLWLLALLVSLFCIWGSFFVSRHKGTRFSYPLYRGFMGAEILLFLAVIVAIIVDNSPQSLFALLLAFISAGVSVFTFVSLHMAEGAWSRARQYLSEHGGELSDELVHEISDSMPPEPASFSEALELLRGEAADISSRTKERTAAIKDAATSVRAQAQYKAARKPAVSSAAANVRLCPACKQDVLPGARFCGSCGFKLSN